MRPPQKLEERGMKAQLTGLKVKICTCIMNKFIDSFYPVTKYFKLEEPNNTKAQGIFEFVDKAFSDLGVQYYHEKLIGYCSDGVIVMQGSNKMLLNF
ncbi:hypothetical protein MAR_003269 [Mya arenaria]|uniref:Uncharacterized protein n=1 Tax=Mya arenaria TaxID=6604 RepID=A0ABY7G9K8_MYAAR|nr:hypothetical protein MAR_003269 [Mya arenaria]